MTKIQDLTGIKFGKLTVLKYVGKNKYRQSLWLCQCECGNQKIIRANDLKSNRVKSCGCLFHKTRCTHKQSKTRLYIIWQGIKKRCLKEYSKDYQNYGGRGIKICDEWKDNFMIFHDWALNNGYTDNLTIDRIDSNGNYEPDNCRWENKKQQARNRRSNKIITYKGESHCISEWLEILGI